MSERRVGSSASVRRVAAVTAVVIAGAFAATALAAPTVTIVSGPSGPTSDSSPTFGFTPGGATTVECSVDQGVESFGPCTAETTHTADTLADGSWTFRVRVTDDLGESVTATQGFSVDTQAPTVTIDSGPSGPTSDSSPTFGFTPIGATTVECSVDQGTPDFGPCTSGTSHAAGPLAEGDWTFRVRVSDAAGNTDAAAREFSVDTQAPAVTIDSGPSGPTSDSSPTFGFTPIGATTVECSVDQGTPDFGPCTTGTTHAAGPLAEGDWTFRVRASDAASNSTTQARGFAIDTTLPTITIDTGPAGPTDDPTPSFGFTPETGTTVQCSIDQGTEAFGQCTTGTSHTAGPLEEGTWIFRVRVTDPGNNSVVLTQSFTVDVTGPAVAIVGPRRTGQRRPAFRVSSTEPGATFACALDSNPAVACGPTFTPRRKLKPGRHRLVATAFDALGNPGPTQAARFRILRPALGEAQARRTVAVALRRHDFAQRVIHHLDTTCSRATRLKFTCRFSSTFPGYSLTGRGVVERRRRLSYRFRARAQGRTMTLTDQNEGRIRA